MAINLQEDLSFTEDGPGKPKKKKVVAPTVDFKVKTIADVPAYDPSKPLLNFKLPPHDFSEAESDFRNYSRTKEDVDHGYEGTISSNPKIWEDIDRRVKAAKQNLPIYSKKRTETINRLTPIIQEFGNNLFGSNEIMDGGGNMEKFITVDESGRNVVNTGAVSKALEDYVRQNKGDRYTIELFRPAILRMAEQNINLYEAAPEIRKRTGKLDYSKPEEQEAVLLSMINNAKAKTRALIKTEETIYQTSVKKLQQEFEPVYADFGMDAVFYYKHVEEDEAKKMEAEMEGVSGYPPSMVQEKFTERVDRVYKERYGKQLEEDFTPIVNAYNEELSNSFKRLKNISSNIADEQNKLLQKQQEDYIAEQKRTNTKINIVIPNIIKEEMGKVAQKRYSQAKGFSEGLMNQSLLPVTGAASMAKLFGDGFMSGLGSLMNKGGIMLNGLGFESDWIDKMKYSGLTMDAENFVMKPELGQSWWKPGYMAQSIGQSAPVMLAGVLTTIATRSPRIGATVATITEGTEIAGGVTERVANETGDWGKAAAAGQEAFVKNIPTYFLEVLTQRMFVPLRLAKNSIGGKIKDVIVGSVGGGLQEGAQTGLIETVVGTDKSVWEGIKSKETKESIIEGTMIGLVTGGGFASVSTFMSMLPKIVPNSRTQAIANSIQRHGEQGATGGVQVQGMIEGAEDDVLIENMNEVKEIAGHVNNAKIIGLNNQQQQMYAGVVMEITELQKKRGQIQEPLAVEAIDDQIKEKKRELSGIVKGETPLASIEMPAGVVFTGEAPKIGEMLQMPEVREGIKDGSITIRTEDKGVIKQLEDIMNEPKEVIPSQSIGVELIDRVIPIKEPTPKGNTSNVVAGSGGVVEPRNVFEFIENSGYERDNEANDVRYVKDGVTIGLSPNKLNPFNKGSEMIPKDEKGFTINIIATDPSVRSKGGASKALKEITDYADKNGETIYLSANDATIGFKKGLNKKQLEDWYGRYGFEKDESIMIRKPQSLKETTKAEPTRDFESEKAKLTEQRDEDIRVMGKPDVSMPFLSAKELVDSKDPIGNKKVHAELKDRYKDIRKLLDCLWA